MRDRGLTVGLVHIRFSETVALCRNERPTSSENGGRPMARSRTTPRPRDVREDPVATPSAPSPEAIAARAHELYLARGRADGHDLDDWLQAERDLGALEVTQTG